MIGDLHYEALQFHIHLNSEHTIRDQYFAAELHIVHQLVTKADTSDDAGARKLQAGVGDMSNPEPFAAVGFILDTGSPLEYYDPTVNGFIPGFLETDFKVSNACNKSEGRFFYKGTPKPDYLINPYAMLPPGPSFYQYLGGLTTPPCTEGVFWNLLSEPIPIAVAQIDTISRLILDHLDPNTCEILTNADPLTGSTSRPPLDPLDREISLVGYCGPKLSS